VNAGRDAFRHWRLDPDPGGILWLSLDRADSSSNTLSVDVLAELGRVLAQVVRLRPRGLVLRSAKPDGFSPGADIGEFARLAGAAEALAHCQLGQALFTALAQLPMPTVAMIHGPCLGGGLELALACRRRVASDAPGTRLGLPEVRLGIHPGFGGSVRLTDLLGPAPALDLMLSGRQLKDPREVRAAMDRLLPDPDGAGAGRADLVLEAIGEDLEAKRALYRALEPRLRPEAVLASATATATLPLERLADGLARPERFLGLRVFQPVAGTRLVEVAAWSGTGRDAADRAAAFVGAIRRLPLPVRAGPGGLVHRVLVPYLMEALILVGEGVAPAEIDRAAEAFGMPVGPVLLADSMGLDTCLALARGLGPACGVPAILEALVAAGHLGRTSGQGCYRFQAGRPVRPRLPAPRPGGGLEQRLLLRMLNAAVACLRTRVVADEDLLDAGLVFGAGFAPFRGGPMGHIRQEGPGRQEQLLAALADQHGARFTPDPGWSAL
jgi:3-hydroxyacyl-CoA dehydrogenase